MVNMPKRTPKTLMQVTILVRAGKVSLSGAGNGISVAGFRHTGGRIPSGFGFLSWRRDELRGGEAKTGRRRAFVAGAIHVRTEKSTDGRDDGFLGTEPALRRKSADHFRTGREVKMMTPRSVFEAR